MNPATDNIFKLSSKNPEAVIFIRDESLEMKKDIQCDLFSGISSTEFALALLDRKRNKFLALEVFRTDAITEPARQALWLKETSKESIILKNDSFKKASVAIVNELTTLIPSALFRKEDAEKYFHFNFNEEDTVIHSEHIRSFDAVNTFAISKPVEEAVNLIFNQPDIHHHETALLEGIFLSFKKSNDKTLLLNIRDGYVDIIVTEGKKLIFINTFSYKTGNDLLYYVMFACDRLQLNPEIISAILMGSVEKETETYHLLYKYIRNVSFSPRLNVFDFSYVFNEIPAHFFFNLFSLALCES